MMVSHPWCCCLGLNSCVWLGILPCLALPVVETPLSQQLGGDRDQQVSPTCESLSQNHAAFMEGELLVWAQNQSKAEQTVSHCHSVQRNREGSRLWNV